MGRFKRVSENEIPQSIEQALFKTASTMQDVESRREALNREMVGFNTEKARVAQDKAWERITSASVLSENKFIPEDEALSNMRPEDISLSGIRRAGYDTDNIAMAMRANPSEMFNDPIAAALRGASMWNDMDEIDGILMEMADADNDKFDRVSAREKQSARVANWEQEKLQEMGSLRNKAYATDRGHSIVKAHHETGVAGRNNMMDYSFIQEREEQRKSIAESRRETRLAIKDHSIKSHDEKHQEWQSGAMKNQVKKFQDQTSSWIDEFDRMVRG